MGFIAKERQTVELTRRRYREQFTALERERSSFESHWRELSEYFRPRRARFTVTDTNKGQRKSEKIIDSTPIFAARTLSAGMMSGITSPARPWFRLTVPDKDLAELHAVKVWLDQVRDRINGVLHRSNFYNALPAFYADMGVFGTAAMLIEEDDATTIRCTHFPIGEYYLASNDKQQVRVFARKLRLTVRQVVDKFGIFDAEGRLSDENLSDSVVNAWRRDALDEGVEVCHLIQPNPEHDPKKLPAAFKLYREVYFEYHGETTKILRVSGYDEWPVLAGRWEANSGDDYGTDCPGMTVLGDSKALQFGEKLGAQAIEKAVKPPMVAPSAAMNTPLNGLPGGVSYVDDPTGKGMRALHDTSGVRIDWLGVEQDKVRARIERAFFVDLFRMISSMEAGSGQMTATEIRVRQEEKLLNLGPVLEGVEDDVLDPAMERIFGVMLRRNELPPPPAELEGMPLRIEYESIMAQAQKAIGRTGLEAFASYVSALAQIQPDALDKLDADQSIDEYAEMTGVSPKVVRGDDDVAEIREARAEAQAKQAAVAQAQQEAETAHTLSQTPTSGDNALAQLLGQASRALPRNGMM